MTDKAHRRLPIGLTLSVLVALGILIALGGWQFQRLAWKQDLLARVAALQSAPAGDLSPLLEQLKAGEDLEYARARVVCPGLAAAPYLEVYGVRGGQAGVRLVSACALEGGTYGSILVDRGFVADTISSRPPVDPTAAAPVEVVGVFRAPEKPSFVTPPNDLAANHWYSRDIAAMAAQLKAPAPAPLFLMAETPTNPEWKALVPAPLPAEITNRHLEYALTWFGLAAALVGVYAAVLWRRWKA
ncbi:MAG: SURF1 family cytochrome oxidase biogenesis protein [Phenylobacterium sp.]|uniref:SURF1 family protein n=1 Tax=Phenylobacterium sp. TaxID=1871053 RepID=UPI002734E014|nr:SURF1 family cytochrome oxidase biogenesis protein [Phenylobacterium sp.]MDP3748400.1 SURF1 family cytochrome oxidase biogenesis protein [Phenylobacterium sp.]